MIFNTGLSIAMKDSCGHYNSREFSMFEMNKSITGFSSIEVREVNKLEFSFKVKCPICGECHIYHYGINDFLKRDINIGGCEITGLPIFFIGRDTKVSERIRKFDEVNKKIYNII